MYKKIVGYNRYIISFVGILLMIILAGAFGNHEIILPEMAALIAGTLIYEEKPWLYKPFHLFILPTITAIAGFLINMLPVVLVVKLIAIIFVMILVLLVFKSRLGPSLATGLLPIITNAHSPAFIVSIIIATLVLYLTIKSLKLDKLASEENAPAASLRISLLYIGIVVLWLFICYELNVENLCAAPPVLVVLFEMIHKPQYPQKMYFKQVAMLTIVASLSVLSLFVFENFIIVAIVNFFIATIVLNIFKLKMPPAYALCILPLVLPHNTVQYLPVSIFAMSVVLYGIIYLLKYKATKNLATA
ncbi:hypothetical protein [Polluticaenibacter yanchengensis]|uniref:HPP family protein n=1 Tax=Polluticaenibacter yanchengensis TaxID=3014562 RepID=A0ABT4UKA8_9BACT|nr:hypothetical protein [Chitinophagaceae bacterium LY-5]